MFSMIRGALAKVFSRPAMAAEQDIVYFGGIEDARLGQNALLFALYVPSKDGLVYLPYDAYEDDVVAQLRTLEIGEAFRILEEEVKLDIGGTVTKISFVEPKQFIRIEGLETNHPAAPLYPVMKL